MHVSILRINDSVLLKWQFRESRKKIIIKINFICQHCLTFLDNTVFFFIEYLVYFYRTVSEILFNLIFVM